MQGKKTNEKTRNAKCRTRTIDCLLSFAMREEERR